MSLEILQLCYVQLKSNWTENDKSDKIRRFKKNN